MSAYVPNPETSTTMPPTPLRLEHLKSSYAAHVAQRKKMLRRLNSVFTRVEGTLSDMSKLRRDSKGLDSGPNRKQSLPYRSGTLECIQSTEVLALSGSLHHDRENPTQTPTTPQFAATNTTPRDHSGFDSKSSHRLQKLKAAKKLCDIVLRRETESEPTVTSSPTQMSPTPNVGSEPISASPSPFVEIGQKRRKSTIIMFYRNETVIQTRKQLWAKFGNWIPY